MTVQGIVIGCLGMMASFAGIVLGVVNVFTVDEGVVLSVVVMALSVSSLTLAVSTAMFVHFVLKARRQMK